MARTLPFSTDTDESHEVQFVGTIRTVIFHSEESFFSVLAVDPDEQSGEVTVVGEMVQPTNGQTIRVGGSWDEHPDYGEQVQAERIETMRPEDESGMRAYLESFVEGVGPAYAKKIVDEFGEDTFDILDEDPDRLKTLDGIGSTKLGKIKESWAESETARRTLRLLVDKGVSRAYALRIYDEYGETAPDVVESDPYRLSMDVDGIGFKQAERIAQNQDDPVDPDRRAEACVLYVLRNGEQSGDCFQTFSDLESEVHEELEDRLDVQSAVRRLEGNGDVVQEENRVYRGAVYYREKRVAHRILEINDTQPDEAESLLDLDDVDCSFDVDYNTKQTEAIRRACSRNVMVLTGGPGTGKTTTTNGIIEVLDENDTTYHLAAPTGRAAKRMEEQTGKPARTLHRLLEFDPQSNTFEKNREKPLNTDVVIVDEVSMMDLYLMDNLLDAVPDEAGLILVGDADQLPSVGAGTVFNDIIESGQVPVVELTDIYRQAQNSGVVMNAHRVNNNQVPQSGYDDFHYEYCPDEQAEDFLVRTVVEYLPEKTGMDPVRDIQVIAPMYGRTGGVDRLNDRLQEHLTGSGDETPTDFRVSDKVMQVSNNYEKDVFNGNTGFVRGYDEEDDTLQVYFPDRDGVLSYSKKERRKQLKRAYAITIHKSQGSEYPAVVMPVAKGHTYMLEKSLLYTAMTRAEEFVIMAGPEETIQTAVHMEGAQERNTRLDERLESFGTPNTKPELSF